ncbi:MAG TPA: LysR substrate-binding domain-containing protein, partial [Stellaceae bacterium]|nr:LysR substrate-binding domain-containing protein [Stellaceae bacterium]
MELRHLRYFVAVAEEGSLTKAAARLHIQQPPLGHQIKALEEELQVRLFDRSPKHIALNANGRMFLDCARRVLAEAAHAVDVVRRFERGEEGHLTVGFTSSASLHHITPRLIRDFRRDHPLVQIDVTERETFELVQALRRRRLDAAFIHIPADQFPELAHHVLVEENLVAALPIDHPYAKDDDGAMLKLGQLDGQNLVVYRRPDGPGIFHTIMLAMEGVRCRPLIVDEVPRIIAALNLVAAGRGITIVPRTLQVLHREAIRYRPIDLAPMPLYILYRRDIELDLVRRF